MLQSSEDVMRLSYVGVVCTGQSILCAKRVAENWRIGRTFSIVRANDRAMRAPACSEMENTPKKSLSAAFFYDKV